ncbi:MAG: hypothetical protein AB1505_15360 [Candidatus Latescibacterota bacterium]
MRPERMLQNEVVAACRAALDAGARRRRRVAGRRAWQRWRAEVLDVVRSAFPAEVFARREPPVARLVSRHDLPHARLENVLFESLPGWEVNATVYLPPEPGVYPGVVCPTGHSTKTGPSYQQPAQVLARCGYVAVSFDPPGCAGEIAHLNDHFTNGLVGYLTGFWSQAHFVLDALRCLDYLQTRPDVDPGAGMAMTGVSGGGMTTLFAALLDERVAAAVPVCCLAEHESIHLQGLYASCPEQFGVGYIGAGLDCVDYVGALAPRPCLLVAGAHDEVFDVRSTRRVARQVHDLYRSAGAPEACRLFVDQASGHAYTVRMACQAVAWLDRHLRGLQRPVPALTEADVPLLDAEELLCHPRPTANMFAVNRERACRLRQSRPPRPDLASLRQAACRLLGLGPGPARARVRRVGPGQAAWHAWVEEVEIQAAAGTWLPGVAVGHAEDRAPRPGLLWLDERGRWAPLRQDGLLTPALRMFEPDCRDGQPRILSVDVSGLGRLEPHPVPYDLAGWNASERILTYLALACGRPVMGLRVRDALGGLACLRARADVDPQRLIVGGRGVGAVVALHAALLHGGVWRVVCLDMLSHYGALTEQFPFAWRQSVVIPGILEHYDLPELAASLETAEVIVVNPRDAMLRPVAQEAAAALYAAALDRGATVHCEAPERQVVLQAIAGG